MSVPAGKRNKGKLAVETDAIKFLDYVLDITAKYYLPPTEEDKKDLSVYSNVKWFADKIRTKMLECVTNIQIANKIKIVDDDTLYQRISHQNQAERELESVLTITTLLYNRKLIKSKRVKYIGGQVVSLKKSIQAWRKSDKERYKKGNSNEKQ